MRLFRQSGAVMVRLFLGCCKTRSSSTFSVPITEVLKRIYKLIGDPRSTALEVGLRYPQSDMSRPMKLEFEVEKEHAQ